MMRPEQVLQIQAARMLELAIPDFVFFHVPNGGGRSKVEGAILKAMGVKAGVADFVIVLPGGRIGFLELKADKGALSQSQREFRDKVRGLGCIWGEARSLEGVWDLVEAWFRPWGHAMKVRRP